MDVYEFQYSRTPEIGVVVIFPLEKCPENLCVFKIARVESLARSLFAKIGNKIDLRERGNIILLL